ncbi:MAG: hypothetical protein FWD97_05725 [Defluviitaleaceae bacterium]|nr:hypothetical protein [Defluviitaleaceae bacterium]
MKTKSKKIIVMLSLTALMAFGFAMNTEVSASESRANAWSGVNSIRELIQASDNMRATFPYRFPYAPMSDFTPNPTNFLVTFNGWLGNVENLEINLLDADLKIIVRSGRSASVQSSDWSTAISRQGSLGGVSTLYIWDNDVSEGIVTLFIPIRAEWFFQQANIHLENGNLTIISDYPLEEFLAEDLNINVVNGSVIGM